MVKVYYTRGDMGYSHGEMFVKEFTDLEESGKWIDSCPDYIRIVDEFESICAEAEKEVGETEQAIRDIEAERQKRLMEERREFREYGMNDADFD